MRALPANMRERRGAIAVNLNPEHLLIGDRPQDFQITLGLGIEVKIEQQIDIRAGAVAHRFQVSAQIAQNILVDIQFGHERHTEPRPPTARGAVVINEDVGLQRAETPLAHFGADRLDAVEAGNRGLIQGRVIDPPGRAMRPVDRDASRTLPPRSAWHGTPSALPLASSSAFSMAPNPSATTPP